MCIHVYVLLQHVVKTLHESASEEHRFDGSQGYVYIHRHLWLIHDTYDTICVCFHM